MDVACASLGLIVASPLLLVLCVLILLTMGPPILFRQLRPGLGGQPFTLLKLRTMKDARDGRGEPLSDSERLTRLGRFLRAASLDELPELINVLRGEMSLVGPRPLLMRYLERYSPVQMRRHEVKPGITGWAQVNGRNALSWEAKFAHDVWYVDHWSIGLDLRILLLTVRQVLLQKGINQEGHATVEYYQGTPEE